MVLLPRSEENKDSFLTGGYLKIDSRVVDSRRYNDDGNYDEQDEHDFWNGSTEGI
jgi:hypothetical protein